MLNQKHLTQRNTYCAVSFIVYSKKRENQTIVLAAGMQLSLREEEGEVLGQCTGSFWILAIFYFLTWITANSFMFYVFF